MQRGMGSRQWKSWKLFDPLNRLHVLSAVSVMLYVSIMITIPVRSVAYYADLVIFFWGMHMMMSRLYDVQLNT